MYFKFSASFNVNDEFSETASFLNGRGDFLNQHLFLAYVHESLNLHYRIDGDKIDNLML